MLLEAEEEKKEIGIGNVETEREPLAKGGLKSERPNASARFKELEIGGRSARRNDKQNIQLLSEKEAQQLKE